MDVASVLLRRAAPLLLVVAAAPAAVSQAFYGLPIASAYRPAIIATGDFDGDELPDAAVFRTDPLLPGSLLLLHGRGDGSLASATTSLDLAQYASSLLAHDLDGNGATDLVVGAGPPTITVFGHGDGTLSFGAQFPVGEILQAADCNGDGLFDVLALGEAADTVKVMRGHGNGSFDILGGFVSDKLPVGLAAADFDGDGRTDAATVGSSVGAASLTVFRAQSDGSLASSAVLPLAAGKSPVLLLAGDFDGDGDQDLLADLSSTHVLDLILGQGDATHFTESAPVSFFTQPTGAAVADLDGDGTLDLAFAEAGNSGSGDVRTLAGHGDGTFAAAVVHDLCEGASGLCATDLDLDGRTDLLCACGSAGAVVSLMGHADGSLGDPTSWGPGANGKMKDVECGDVDGDGDVDVLAIGDFGSGSTSGPVVYEGAGDGTFPTKHFASGGSVLDFVLADLNGDAVLDIVGRTHSGPPVISAEFRPGLGNGQFGAAVQSLVPANFADFVLADFDGDGGLDMAASCGTENDVRVLHGSAGGAFTQIAQVAVSGHAGEIDAADLNLDGVQDIVTIDYLPAISRILGTGGGQFAAALSTPASSDPTSLVLGDFAGDAAPDLVLSDYIAGAWGVEVQPGLGDGSFGPGNFVATSAGLGLRRAADVDSDGHLDLVLSYYFKHLLGVVLTRPDGALTFPCASWAGKYGGDVIATGDFDGDGRVDIAAPSTTALGPLRVMLHEDTPVAAWTNLGHPLAGVAGAPHLVGSGTLEAGSSGALTLSQSAPSATALLFVSLSATPTLFKGGKLVAFPPAAMIPLLTTGGGGLALPWSSWPSGLSGAALCFQIGIQDGAALHGVALSNAVQRVVP